VKRYTVQVTPAGSPLPGFTLAYASASTIYLGETFDVITGVENEGWDSDDGRIGLGFPSFIDPGDGQWTSSNATGDSPGYVEYPAGSPLSRVDCQAMTAGYMVVEYQDSAWHFDEQNQATIKVRPQAAGTFVVEVRSTMHRQGGTACEVVGGVPPLGDRGVDQQGWPVWRLTVTVLPAIPEPVFTANVDVPSVVEVGQPVTVTVSVRNDAAMTDDGRISVSFPALSNPADAQWVTSASGGDTPGFVVIPAGGTLSGNTCEAVTASYVAAEYRDDGWAGHGSEINTFAVTAHPQATGSFDIYVRTTMREAGAACGQYSALPGNGAGGFVDQQGFAVKKFTVTVNPAPPITIWFPSGGPAFPSAILLGQSFTLSQGVTITGGSCDDGRIVFSFPSFTQPSDNQWVTSASAGDTPGYRELPAGATLAKPDCEPVAASYLVAEYADDAWSGASENNLFTLSVQPQSVGTFYFFARVTLHEAGRGCFYANTVPPGGQDGFVDQQGFAVRRYAVNVIPTPDPIFVGPVEVVSTIIQLGQSFTIAATVRNDGAASNQGEIIFGFPELTTQNSDQYVVTTSAIDPGEYRGSIPPYSAMFTANCQIITTNHYWAPYLDFSWTSGETNTVSLAVTPQATGPFHVDVYSFLYQAGGGQCSGKSAVPPNGTPGTNERGYAVKRYTVEVVAPAAAAGESHWALDLAGAEPNPARGDLMVSFSLPGPEPATLELFDLGGRRLAQQAVGGFGAGRHRARLMDGRQLPVGIYLVRLTRGDRVLEAKASVLK
jgi:hypothetical protein